MSHYLIREDDTSIVVHRKYWQKIFDNFEILIYDVGKENCRGGHDCGPCKRECHVIHKVIYGAGFFIVNGKRYTLRAGDVFYFSPDDHIYYCADREDPLVYIWIGFNGIKSGIIMKSTIFPDEYVLRDTEDKIVENGILSVFDTVKNDANIYSVTGSLYSFFGTLIDRYGKSNLDTDDSIGVSYLNNAIDYIENNYADNCSIFTITSHLGITRSYLFKIFKQYLNVSPSRYIENYRMKVACKLLANGSISIDECACSVGYRDRAYFSKVFKKVIGVYPKEYILQNTVKADWQEENYADN